MARYLLKRIWGPASEEAMLENALRSKRVRDASYLDITWEHSHVVADDDGRAISYCVYDAPSVERVLEHASATGGHFVDRVLALTDDVEGSDARPLTPGDPSPRYLVIQRWDVGVTRDRIDADVRHADASALDVSWEHSHLGTDDGGQILSHGVYRASDEAIVRRHAARIAGGEITEVYEIGGDVKPEDLVG